MLNCCWWMMTEYGNAGWNVVEALVLWGYSRSWVESKLRSVRTFYQQTDKRWNASFPKMDSNSQRSWNCPDSAVTSLDKFSVNFFFFFSTVISLFGPQGAFIDMNLLRGVCSSASESPNESHFSDWTSTLNHGWLTDGWVWKSSSLPEEVR